MTAAATSRPTGPFPVPGSELERADPPDADRADWPTGRLLSTAARLVEHAWAARLAQQGLTHAGLVTLHALVEGQSLSLAALATRCQVTPQTMTRTLDRLERDGLVQRRRSGADRRRVVVRLTPAGERAHLAASDMAAAEPHLLGDVVDLPALRRNLLAIIDHLRAPDGA